eukprot:3689143-Rhodomonas_salina.3
MRAGKSKKIVNTGSSRKSSLRILAVQGNSVRSDWILACEPGEASEQRLSQEPCVWCRVPAGDLRGPPSQACLGIMGRNRGELRVRAS